MVLSSLLHKQNLLLVPTSRQHCSLSICSRISTTLSSTASSTTHSRSSRLQFRRVSASSVKSPNPKSFPLFSRRYHNRPKGTSINFNYNKLSSSSSSSSSSSTFILTIPPATKAAKLDSQVRQRSDKSSSNKHSHDHDHDHDHGHSHSHGLFGHHHHHHDNSFLTSKNKTDAGVRITRIGLYVNVGMAISKGFGGWYFNSQALVADAAHALTDLVSDFMTLATVSWALKPPTSKFPNGFGKVESLGSLGVSSLLLFGGLAMGWNSGLHIYAQMFAENASEFMEHVHSHGHGHGHGHSHSHSHADLGPNINAAWLAGGSILVKEWLYRATMKVAKARRSSVLASNAVHHRIDSLTAMVALISIMLSNIIKDAAWLDPVGGLLVSLMVIQAGFSNTRSALMELVDMAIDDETREDVTKIVEDTLKAQRLATVEPGVSGKLESVTGIKSGQSYLVDIVVSVAKDVNVVETAKIENALREAIGTEVRGCRRVKIRFVPEGESSSEFIKEGKEDLGSEDEHEHEHDHEHKDESNKKAL